MQDAWLAHWAWVTWVASQLVAKLTDSASMVALWLALFQLFGISEPALPYDQPIPRPIEGQCQTRCLIALTGGIENINTAASEAQSSSAPPATIAICW